MVYFVQLLKSKIMKDTYLTIETPSIGEYREKGSKFIAYTFPVYSEEEVKECLEEVKKEHFKARHYCYAYRIGLDGKRFRANDDGEPSGTAGRPILGQIDSFGLANVLSVVVRYFGGTKLGTGGLQRAYGGSVRQALTLLVTKTKIPMVHKTLACHYNHINDVHYLLEKLGGKVIKEDYQTEILLEITLPDSELDNFKEKIETLSAGELTLEDK